MADIITEFGATMVSSGIKGSYADLVRACSEVQGPVLPEWKHKEEQPETDLVTKAVRQLARKELLILAAGIRERIRRGGWCLPQHPPSFAETVDEHIHKFQPYFELTGATHRQLEQILPCNRLFFHLNAFVHSKTLKLTKRMHICRCDS